MIDVPHEVLSEHFEERMQGRRLVAGVFTTFEFEPAFFEQEVLPVFLDLNLSHVPVIRAVQLEEALRTSNVELAVYYDANRLLASADASAKLDCARIPVRQRSGLFHPKNLLILVEEVDPNDDGTRAQTLLVAAMSANLTKSGWWSNVECCHVEELGAGASTRMKDELLAFIKLIRERSPAGVAHVALDAIHKFVRGTDQHARRREGSRLRTHFHGGTKPFIDFINDAIGDEVKGWNLEVISPFFDQADESGPLEDLVRRFKPAETRVFLPRNAAGDAEVPEGLYEWVRDRPGVVWGTLPGELTRTSNNDSAVARNVHAKVYRFFQERPRGEYLVIGSVNLTRPAHQNGGNVESALLVETDPTRRPEFWLVVDGKRPREFVAPADGEGDEAVSAAGSRLAIRYDWRSGIGEAYWDGAAAGPRLEVRRGGVEQFVLESLPPRVWTAIGEAGSAALRKSLEVSSFLDVVGDRPDPVTILVLEGEMWKKPPLIARMSLKDILTYWSLLTPEQRNEFIAARADEILGNVEASHLMTRTTKTAKLDTLFDRFAGIFHAFECTAAAVRQALEEGHQKDALHRLFGPKHDTLRSLLDRLRTEVDRELVDRYVIAMCARQLCNDLRRTQREFWSEHATEVAELEQALAIADELRDELAAKDPSGMPEFLEWFDRRFLLRAPPVEAQL